MALFKIEGKVVKRLNARGLDLERELQLLFEANLEEVLYITFLAHEYATSFGGRIDTLGIDKHGSPCIIEYKKKQNNNVINQGLAYLRWLLDHKADFGVLCRSKKVDVEIDWDSPRVICVAESYNKFDLDVADLLPINIELFRYRIYSDDILYLEPERYQNVRTSSQIGETSRVEKRQTESLQKNYSVEYHLRKADVNIKTLFFKLREQILELDEKIKEEPKKLYIAYKLSTNFVDVEIRSKDIKIFLNVKSGELQDPNHLARDLTKPKPTGHWGNGDYEVKLNKDSDFITAVELIKQSYNLNK